jgi:hypothetical protein
MPDEAFVLDAVPAGARLHEVTARPVAHRGRAALRVELAPATVVGRQYLGRDYAARS